LIVTQDVEMKISVQSANTMVYENKTPSSVDATIGVSGRGRLDVNLQGEATVQHHFQAPGGVVTITAAAGAKIDANPVHPSTSIEVEFIHFR
jgi:hypothetical protein